MGIDLENQQRGSASVGNCYNRDPESGLSAGAIQTDEPWKYDAEVEARNEVRFNEFRQNLPF